MVAESPARDFFISYTAVNRPWAEWIAVQLEQAGYTTVLQAWDFRPGSDFIHEMQQVFAAMGPLLTELDPDREGVRDVPSGGDRWGQRIAISALCASSGEQPTHAYDLGDRVDGSQWSWRA